jgi:hypothetical protein
MAAFDAATWIGQVVPSLVSMAGGGTIGVLITKYWEHKRRQRAQTDQVALSLVDTLTERLARVEADQARERALCDANLAVLRHRLNNALQLFEGLLMVIEAAPDKAADYVSKIKERRAQQEQAEATEKAAIQAAIIAAAGGPASPEPDPKP